MNRIYRMKNPIQPYAWGSMTLLAEWMMQPVPAETHQAELWMGAHPKASSQIWYQDSWHSLLKMIQENPVLFLGSAAAERYQNQFPFLFKVLAVEQPLSIQAHPNAKQARNGFERENQLGIALSAPHRNYRDNQPKPECVCALTPFWIMCGFRKPCDILTYLEPIWPPNLINHLDKLKHPSDAVAIRQFFQYIMVQSKPIIERLILHIIDKAVALSQQNPIYHWMVQLQNTYPNDIGVISPAILNLGCLQPGQAIFLPAGQLHAYLNGLAVELMANSDNVLRGGLTSKHIDVPELMSILDYHPRPIDIISPAGDLGGWQNYRIDIGEFSLSVVSLDGYSELIFETWSSGPQIILCTQGAGVIHWSETADPIPISRGQSLLILPARSTIRISGRTTLFKASTGLSV